MVHKETYPIVIKAVRSGKENNRMSKNNNSNNKIKM